MGLTEKFKKASGRVSERIGEGLPAGQNFFLAWSKKKLSSITTSVYLLWLLVFFYVIGTIFPQDGSIDEYIKAGGKYVFFVKLFSLLDLFSSPLFIIAAVLILLNLAVCTWQRYLGLFQKRSFPAGFEPASVIRLTQDINDAQIDVREALRKLRFKVVSKEGWVVMEKGLPYRWLTWLYHVGLLVCFAGFFITYLFAFEGTITLRPREPQTVSPDKTGRLSGLWRSKTPPSDFSLSLEEFMTDYNQTPSLEYPKDKASRLAIGLGWKAPAYTVGDESLSARAWRSRVRVRKASRTLYEKTVEVNGPLRFGGYTFYQEGYEQRLKIRVDQSPIALETKTGEDLIVPGLDGPLKFGTLRNGTLFRLDGTVEKLKPFTTVKRQVKGPKGEKRYDDAGRLEQGGSIDIDGRRIALAAFEEHSVLSYRYDPGVGLLWWGGIFVLIAMSLRFYGGWHQVAYRIEERDRIVHLDLCVTARGFMADEARLVKRIESALTKNDIKPERLPDTA